MPGIGNQRQTVGADAGDQLENDERRGRNQRPDKNPPGRRAMLMVRVQSVPPPLF
jgi:hypothetical protein